MAGHATACECRIFGTEIAVTFVRRLHLSCGVVRAGERSCLSSNSLMATIHLESDVVVADESIGVLTGVAS